jgi:hypothetical protein
MNVEQIKSVETEEYVVSDEEYVKAWAGCVNVLSDLFLEYKDNTYALNKMSSYVINLASVIRKNLKEKDEKDKQREKINKEKDMFVSKFLQTHNYSYCPNTELFFNYDGMHYSIYKEDYIQHEILISITEGQNLLPLKQKTKINIIKQIKEISPLNSIPETNTIQYVINKLHPSVFKDKDGAKYFLTLIGDSILRKNENLIYIISPRAKGICMDVLRQAYDMLGITHIFNCIKYKYYDHNYQDCRLIMINDISQKTTLDSDLSKHILDFLCVACYYSNRYGCSDKFLENSGNITLINHSLYLKNNDLENIVDNFINKSIEKCVGVSVKWKNMFYLWKNFLDTMNVPNIAFNAKLKTLLSQKLEYNDETDSFNNVTSVLLPQVSSFMKFWDETMIKDEDETELEIDEISNMFKSWAGKTVYSINEDMLLDLIQHFHPDTIIEDDKYIQNYTCKLWDKKTEIITALEHFKTTNKDINTTESLYNIYDYYCKLYSNKSYRVSKQYFEKFALEYIGDIHIDIDNIILPSWWSN